MAAEAFETYLESLSLTAVDVKDMEWHPAQLELVCRQSIYVDVTCWEDGKESELGGSNAMFCIPNILGVNPAWLACRVLGYGNVRITEINKWLPAEPELAVNGIGWRPSFKYCRMSGCIGSRNFQIRMWSNMPPRMFIPLLKDTGYIIHTDQDVVLG